MDLFRSGIKSVLGAPPPSRESDIETIQRLVDRLETSTLLDDRRGACRALKSMSRTHRVEVGAHGMAALVRALQTDANDGELAGYALEALCNITCPELLDDELPDSSVGQQGELFTEIFIKEPDRVPIVLNFLEEFDFRVRWPAVKLLTSLLANKPREIQDIILISPMGVSKLMDLLSDSREVIRNDVLLLLIQLTKGNANLQKIVAFENAFDRIFEVIKDEGLADGGIIVQDCLLLMLNLLRNNVSNMNFFKEGSYIQRLAPMFSLPDDQEERDKWTPQRVANIHCMLQVIRALVSPSNPNQVTTSCQQMMHSSGLLAALCDTLMAIGVPNDVLTETINTVGEVIRGNFHNQEFFAGVMAPSEPPRPSIVLLLMSMVNEKQPFMLRCAVLYSFQCFLYKNEYGQAQLVQTLLPSTIDASSLTSGQLLCGGLFSSDDMSNWFSAVALSHAICDNLVQKEQLLKVLLATSPGSAPVSLLHQCSILLQQSNRLQCKVGLLMLLCVWLANCPHAVAAFVSVPSNIPFLTAQATIVPDPELCTLQGKSEMTGLWACLISSFCLQTGSSESDEGQELVQGLCAFLLGICVHFNDNSVSSFTKESLSQIIGNRIGLEEFLDKLGSVSRHEQYSQALKHPQLRPPRPQDLLLDHEFCRLVKAMEGLISKSVSPTEVPDCLLVMQYKDVIRDQDNRFQELVTELSRLRVEETTLRSRLDSMTREVTQLRDENVLLRACANDGEAGGARALIESLQAQISQLKANAASSEPDNTLNARVSQLNVGDTQDNTQLEEDLARERSTSSRLASELAHLRGEVSRLGAELIAERDRADRAEVHIAELDKLRENQESFLALLNSQDTSISLLKGRLRDLGEKIDDDDSDEDHSTSLSGT